MTDETVMKVLAIQKELDLLTNVQEAIRPVTYEDGEKQEYRLTYITKALTLNGRKWQPVNMQKMTYISDILNRHDKQIRQEIDERIAELGKELEAL